MNKIQKGLAGLAVAGISLVGLANKAQASPIISTSTQVSVPGVDMDATRAGIQRQYTWNVTNEHTTGSLVSDSLSKYSIDSDLSGFYQLNAPTGWTYTSAFENTSGNALNNIYWGQTRTFSGLIDESRIAGDSQVNSQAIASSGSSNYSSVNVSIPEPSTLSLLVLGAMGFAFKRKK